MQATRVMHPIRATRAIISREAFALPLFLGGGSSGSSRCLASRARSSEVAPAAAASPVVASDGIFRRSVQVEGVSVVSTPEAAERALKELQRRRDRPHARDTEMAGLVLGSRQRLQSPVTHGRVVCATCFCGDDADFGNGPRLFVDNTGAADGLIAAMFKEYFEDPKFKKIFHNYSFDRHAFRRHGIDLAGFHADTMHLARLYDTARSSWEGAMQAKMIREAKEKEAAAKRANAAQEREAEALNKEILRQCQWRPAVRGGHQWPSRARNDAASASARCAPRWILAGDEVAARLKPAARHDLRYGG